MEPLPEGDKLLPGGTAFLPVKFIPDFSQLQEIDIHDSERSDVFGLWMDHEESVADFSFLVVPGRAYLPAFHRSESHILGEFYRDETHAGPSEKVETRGKLLEASLHLSGLNTTIQEGNGAGPDETPSYFTLPRMNLISSAFIT